MSQRKRLPFLVAVLPTVMLAACGNAEAGNATANAAANDAPREQQKLAGSPNESWINLTGSVVATTPESFTLDYGPGNVMVEMDDWDWYDEGRAIKAGDNVVVTGRVDDDLFHDRRIEASSVYVKNLGTFFYANGMDEEATVHSGILITTMPTLVDATGVVTSTNGREFTIGTGANALRVDTAQMAANPMDEVGFQQVDVGDRVHVWGDFDLSAGEGTELMADGLILTQRDATAQS